MSPSDDDDHHHDEPSCASRQDPSVPELSAPETWSEECEMRLSIPQPPECRSRAQLVIGLGSDSHLQTACSDPEQRVARSCAFDLGAWGKMACGYGSSSEVWSAVTTDLCRDITSMRFCSNDRWGGTHPVDQPCQVPSPSAHSQTPEAKTKTE
jgi:hypothetical protein